MNTNGRPPQETKTVNNMTVYKGRWGWYPCDYDIYLEVKEFHKLSLRDVQATRRKERYLAKMKHNRKGIEPPPALGMSIETYKWILEEYRKIRYPKPTAETVTSINLPRKWKNDLADLRDHYLAVEPVHA